jgi:3',5'-cyclic AMP phosphodiesterase CpdA
VTDFLLAHISDPHLAPLPRPRLKELAGKRMLGFANWKRGRDDVHRTDVLEALIADVRAHAPDHIAVTGDLTNLALDEEIHTAARWLVGLSPPDRVTVVPGNHDAYVPGALDKVLAAWAPYVASDDGTTVFPTLRRRGPVTLVGLSTAVTTAPFMATGVIGQDALVQLGGILDSLARETAARIVLLHHPLRVERRQAMKRLTNARALRAVLSATGAELVLHGHMHVSSRWDLSGPRGPIPVVGVASASSDPERGKEAAGWCLFRIRLEGERPRLVMERRATSDGATFRTVETLCLSAQSRTTSERRGRDR